MTKRRDEFLYNRPLRRRAEANVQKQHFTRAATVAMAY